ncbi:armadillo-type protein [Pisolithus croceorrhizus]|nr:armadillo-type protein [Pisolithus croceorrhizus]KAI6168820.1 armadillo-type protein [Pisolithus thermaeus]
MAVCKEKPPHLPQLDILGIEPVDQSSFGMSHGGFGRHRPPSGSMSAAAVRSASIGLSLGQGFQPGAPPGPFAMGQLGTPGTKLTSEERFLMSQGVRSASVGSGPAATLLGHPALKRTATQDEKRSDPSEVGPVQQGPGFGPGVVHQVPALEPVAPLQPSANRWVPASAQRNGAPDADAPEVVDRKVKGLLNKLTMEKFDSISDQIIAWANKSENERDGRTLFQVIRLIFEHVTDDARWSEMYARLCRKMMETISPKVQDSGIKNAEGKPITGGQLFRKYLLSRCQEDFERGWVAKEATARAAAAKASDDEAIKAANKQGDGSELYSDEHYAAQKARRQGLGLIKFIGELFKLQMLTERIMHECVKKLISNVENPEEEEIESLCQLLRVVGKLLDVQKAHGHMDMYFQRIRELCKSPKVRPRIQSVLLDVIELRERKWQPRNVVNAPTTLAVVHEAAAKEKAAQENQAFQRQFSMSLGDSKRGGEHNADPAPDGWAVAGGSQPRPPSKAGDLSHFGKISKAAPMVMGPSSVFAGKKDSKRESLTRTNSSSNMFSMLSQNPELPIEPKPSRAPSRRPGTDMDKPEPVPQRRKLQLLPRSIPAPRETPPPTSEDEPEGSPATQMSEEDAKKKIDEDVKEFFAVRNLEEADAYFTALTEDHRFRLVDKLVSSALEGKEADARLVADFFSRSASQQECSPDVFEAGFAPMVELLDDIAIDAPKAPQHMAIMLKGAGLDKDGERLKRMAEKMMDSDMLLQLVSS